MRTFDLPVDEFYKLSGSWFWESTKSMRYALGATLYMIGDTDIDLTEQGCVRRASLTVTTSCLLAAQFDTCSDPFATENELWSAKPMVSVGFLNETSSSQTPSSSSISREP